MGNVTEMRKSQPEKVVRLTRTPAWIRRMNEGKLPDKDMTGWHNGAWTRSDQGGAA